MSDSRIKGFLENAVNMLEELYEEGYDVFSGEDITFQQGCHVQALSTRLSEAASHARKILSLRDRLQVVGSGKTTRV